MFQSDGDVYDGDLLEEKRYNHWKLMFACLGMTTVPFLHINLMNFCTSRWPAFERLRKNSHKLASLRVVNFLLDFLFTVVPIAVMFAGYHFWIYVLTPAAVGLSLVFLFASHGKSHAMIFANPRKAVIPLGPDKYKFVFVDYLVTLAFLVGCFAVQFSDVAIFPDELSKTAVDGVGFMDLGAGLILFTSGLTSRQARRANVPLKKRILDSLVIIWVCLDVGIIRVLMYEFSDVGDHSHGSHWNIFLIIAMVMIIAICLIPNAALDHADWIAFVLMLVYQTCLKYGLQKKLLEWETSREFWHSNAVGIAQTVGFLACYLIGLSLGRRLYKLDYTREGEEKWILVEQIKLFAISMLTFLVAYYMLDHTAPRLCNLAYVAYVTASASYVGIVIFLSERMISSMCRNVVFEGPARTSRLIYFVAANLLTGAIKVTMSPSEQSAAVGACISMGYMLVLHGILAFMVVMKWRLKFW